jgi:hypothetical protein
MTSTDFFSIFTGWRATDNVTIKAFTIISGRFKMSFAISPITYMRRRRLQPSFLLLSSRTSPLVGVVSYLGVHLAEHPIILQFFPL